MVGKLASGGGKSRGRGGEILICIRNNDTNIRNSGEILKKSEVNEDNIVSR